MILLKTLIIIVELQIDIVVQRGKLCGRNPVASATIVRLHFVEIIGMLITSNQWPWVVSLL